MTSHHNLPQQQPTTTTTRYYHHPLQPPPATTTTRYYHHPLLPSPATTITRYYHQPLLPPSYLGLGQTLGFFKRNDAYTMIHCSRIGKIIWSHWQLSTIPRVYKQFTFRSPFRKGTNKKNSIPFIALLLFGRSCVIVGHHRLTDELFPAAAIFGSPYTLWCR